MDVNYDEYKKSRTTALRRIRLDYLICIGFSMSNHPMHKLALKFLSDERMEMNESTRLSFMRRILKNLNGFVQLIWLVLLG